MDTLKTLLRQPFWIIALVAGAGLVALPYVTIDKDNHRSPHARISTLPIVIGIALIALASIAFALSLWLSRSVPEGAGSGLDFSRLKREKGSTWTTVAGCDIRVVEGRIQDFASDPGAVVVLPCNEYFDDECAGETRRR